MNETGNLASICAEVVPSFDDVDENGRVYFLDDGSLIKIGHAQDLPYRHIVLERQSGRKLTLIGSISAGIHSEFSLHQKFEHLRAKGEWFKPAAEFSAFIDEQRTLGFFMEPNVTCYLRDGRKIVMMDEVLKVKRDLATWIKNHPSCDSRVKILANNLKHLINSPDRVSLRLAMIDRAEQVLLGGIRATQRTVANTQGTV